MLSRFRIWPTSSAIFRECRHPRYKIAPDRDDWYGCQHSPDGVIGPGSIQALGALPQQEVYRRFKQGRIAYYQALGQKYPKFLQGWLNRVNSFPDL